jgi:hypothetical protein
MLVLLFKVLITFYLKQTKLRLLKHVFIKEKLYIFIFIIS